MVGSMGFNPIPNISLGDMEELFDIENEMELMSDKSVDKPAAKSIPSKEDIIKEFMIDMGSDKQQVQEIKSKPEQLDNQQTNIEINVSAEDLRSKEEKQAAASTKLLDNKQVELEQERERLRKEEERLRRIELEQQLLNKQLLETQRKQEEERLRQEKVREEQIRREIVQRLFRETEEKLRAQEKAREEKERAEKERQRLENELREQKQRAYEQELLRQKAEAEARAKLEAEARIRAEEAAKAEKRQNEEYIKRLLAEKDRRDKLAKQKAEREKAEQLQRQKQAQQAQQTQQLKQTAKVQTISTEAEAKIKKAQLDAANAKKLAEEASIKAEEAVKSYQNTSPTSKYDMMDVEALYGEVRKFLKLHNIDRKIIDIKILENEFGRANIKKLIVKSYLISIGKGVTVGR